MPDELLNDPALASTLRRLVVEPRVAPGGTAAVAARSWNGQWVFSTGAAGQLEYEEYAPPQRVRPVNPDSLYDLASLTKPVTALTCARLVGQGSLSFTTPLGAILAEARGTPSENARVEDLLSHRAGLLPHVEFFAPLRQLQPFDLNRALVMAASARRDECTGDIPAQGFAPLYSDLGYLLLGEALQRLTNKPLDELMNEQVNSPLRIELRSARQWAAHGDFLTRVAPTEIVSWRGGLICGQVHDENAWAFAGSGSAGNAGLFSQATDVAKLGMALLDALDGKRSEFIEPTLLSTLVAARPGGTLRAGFDGKSTVGSSAGQLFGPGTFGHLGFTGTSLWCDPDAHIVAAVLTNRVHPTRNNT
ncbi:MAG TPA: serine hydrolase domain-containing protein, partial [Polyangiaceae bacterium]|nr:serine hydrolase domain-containing protein [Polyangiaceae bacterium]